MNIWHISDTHGFHGQLKAPEGIDIVIHSGDASNYKEPYRNEQEMRNFLYWFSMLPIKHKVYVAGNHDTSVERGLVTKYDFDSVNIHYLENSSVEINGVKIWGSPHTPTLGDWAFMKPRTKLYDKVWVHMPDDADIVVVHGPPKGIMDLSLDRMNNIEMCGCSSLRKRVLQVEPKLFLSGHIHNCKDIINAGVLKLSQCETIFSNGSVVTDGKFGILSSNGNVLII